MRLVLLATFLLAACGGSTIPRPTGRDVARAQVTWPDTTQASLERGRQLYVARCSGCHPLHAPASYPAARWQSLVGEMAPRARLDQSERDLVLRYLTALSADAPRAAR